LQYPRSLIPVLRGDYQAGGHWLMCAVLGLAAAGDADGAWKHPPYLRQRFGLPLIVDGVTNAPVLRIDAVGDAA
jgi:hypothetical protein